MKRLFAILVFCMVIIFPTTALSLPCNEYDYQELNDMDKVGLEDAMRVNQKIFMLQIRLIAAGGRVSPYDQNSCSKTLRQIDNVYLKKFKVMMDINTVCKDN